MSKSHRSLCVSFSRQMLGGAYTIYSVKFKLLAQFPVDHPAHPVMSSIVLFLCKFAAFAYYMIDGFVSITTQPTFAVLLRLIYFRFDMTGSYGVVFAAIRRDSFSLLRFPFFSHVQVLSWEMLFISRLKRS